MSKNKKLSVTAAVIAYNEEANIKSLLRSIIGQSGQSFALKRTILISDGSTDTTVKQAQSLRSSKIKIVAGKNRLGKSERLNQLYSACQADILAHFDADVVLGSRGTIEKLIRPFLRDDAVGLVGGNPQVLPGRTLMEKGANCSFRVYDKLRVTGRWAYGCDGRILALSKKLARKTKIPSDMIANDAYVYFEAKKLGFKFVHVRGAVVRYRSPQTIRDQIRQNTRFVAAHYRLERIFGDIVKEEYRMPKGFYFRETLKEFIGHPIESGLLFGVNLICRLRARREEASLNALWQIAQSTKVLQ